MKHTNFYRLTEKDKKKYTLVNHNLINVSRYLNILILIFTVYFLFTIDEYYNTWLYLTLLELSIHLIYNGFSSGDAYLRNVIFSYLSFLKQMLIFYIIFQQ